MRWIAAVLAFALGACGSDGGGEVTTDGAVGDGGTGATVTAPALPAFACPDGWRAVEADGYATCDPWPETGPVDCTAKDEAHFVGEPGCARIGPACPADGWPADLPSDQPVVYVQRGATGGDGSRAAPLGRVANGVAAAPAGGIVALAAATYLESVTIDRPELTLWGACVAETMMFIGLPPASMAILRVEAPGTVVKNLHIDLSAAAGFWVQGPDVDLTLEDVSIEHTQVAGIYATGGAHVDATNLIVRDVEPPYTLFGRGLDFVGATGTIRRAVFERNHDIGVGVFEAGGSITLEDVAIRDTRDTEDPLNDGRGGVIQEGASMEMRRVVVEQSRDCGIFASDPGSTVRLEDVIVRDGLGRSLDGTFGRGMNAQWGPTVELSRVLFEGNRQLGLYASRDGTRVVADDLVIRDTDSDEAGRGGRGMTVQIGAEAEVTRAILERNREVAMLVAGGTARVADLVIRETRERASNGLDGRAIHAQLGAMLELNRALIDNNRFIGIGVGGVDTAIVATDVVVRDTQTADCVTADCPLTAMAVGIGAYSGGSLSATRFEVDETDVCGVLVATDGQLDLSTGVVGQCPFGACIQIEDYDIARLSDEVYYLNNDVNLAATELPVPAALGDLGEL